MERKSNIMINVKRELNASIPKQQYRAFTSKHTPDKH